MAHTHIHLNSDKWRLSGTHDSVDPKEGTFGRTWGTWHLLSSMCVCHSFSWAHAGFTNKVTKHTVQTSKSQLYYRTV